MTILQFQVIIKHLGGQTQKKLILVFPANFYYAYAKNITTKYSVIKICILILMIDYDMIVVLEDIKVQIMNKIFRGLSSLKLT